MVTMKPVSWNSRFDYQGRMARRFAHRGHVTER